MKLNQRTTQLLDMEQHRWVDINPEYIKKGDIFMAFENDGTSVIIEGLIIFTAADDAKNIGGILTTQIIIEDI